MYIIIAGGGVVGFNIASLLSVENHDVVVIEESAAAIESIQRQLDVRVVRGNAAGGLKVIRLLILFKYAYRRILLAINPSAVIPLKIGEIVLPENTISRTIGLTVFYIGLLWGGFVLMAALGLPFEEAIASVTASMGSIGPGLGAVGPYGNFAHIPLLGKAALTFFMLARRLEIFALLVLFTPAFWRRS